MEDKQSSYKDRFFNIFKFKKDLNFIDLLETGIEKELVHSPDEAEPPPIPKEIIPVDISLRPPGFFRKIYEDLFPVSHVFKVSYKHNREYLENFMPISNSDYIGRGTYKLVYTIPRNQVVKIGASILPSDPLFGSLYHTVSDNLDVYLKQEELELKTFLLSQTRSPTKRELICFKFRRLGLERLHYWKVKSLVPDLVWPTLFFMGARYRRGPLGVPMVSITPCDTQNLIPGKHLKEFAQIKEKLKPTSIKDSIFPKWKLNFDTHKFGLVSKSKLKKIAFNFHRVIEVTKYLASKEKLILDIHSENIIITLPDFELKLFDFHVFDEHLYESSHPDIAPEQEHINLIKEFIDSFELSKNGSNGDSQPILHI